MGISSDAPLNGPDPTDPPLAEPARPGEQHFFNEPLDVSGLPELASETFESLDPNYLRVRLIGDAIFGAVVIVAAAVAAFFLPWWIVVLAAAGLLSITALSAWLQRLEVDHLGYLVRDKDFSYRSGVISRNVTTVPFARVQHVSIDRGPLARYFGMATLQMRTAGDGLTVPGMNHDTAVKLKALVVDRAGVLADEELAEDQPTGFAADQPDPIDRPGPSNDQPGPTEYASPEFP